jgi:uracil-DNA glycosylase family 4
VAKRKVEMPQAPGGDIASLPVLEREAKLARLRELQNAASALLTPLLDDVATKVVFGEGDVDAPVLFVGEGPGVEEDKTGRPFVGKSGQMLDKWIAAMGYQREGIYIANVVKLRAADWDQPTARLKDRPPTPEEVARSIHILHQQIEIIRPRAIVTLGAPAVKWLTGTTEGVMKIRGTWMHFRGIPLMPTYHPAFVLRAYTTENRGKVWADLQAVMARLKP